VVGAVVIIILAAELVRVPQVEVSLQEEGPWVVAVVVVVLQALEVSLQEESRSLNPWEQTALVEEAPDGVKNIINIIIINSVKVQ
jgi:hypothetical protein